ncbi:hypothetical protein [Spirosoma gilvum]
MQTELAGYKLKFPNTIAELAKEYPNGQLSGYHKFIDSSQSAKAEWQFDSWSGSYDEDRRIHPYGVIISLKNKADQLDSLKTNLERQYNQPFTLFTLKSAGKENYNLDPPIYSCQIAKGTILLLSKAVSDRGDSWSQYNSLRISVGYNLTEREEEMFALKSGEIHEKID